MEDLHKALAEATRSTRCLIYDACPIRGGLIVNIDGYSMSESMLPWSSPSDWAWKSLVAAASDIVASGGKPIVAMYSIGVRSRDEALRLAKGVGEAAGWLGLEVVKSDTNRCRHDAWIDVAAIGVAEAPVSRGGAMPGDLVVQVGYAGYGAVAGLVLAGKMKLEHVNREIIEYTRRPRPPIGMGVALPRCGVHASSDNSDGLAYTVAVIAEASQVSVDLDDPLVDPSVVEVLERGGINVPMAVYSSWEDYNLVVVVGKDRLQCLLDACRSNNTRCKVIGKVREGRGITYRGRKLEFQRWSWL